MVYTPEEITTNIQMEVTGFRLKLTLNNEQKTAQGFKQTKNWSLKLSPPLII